MPGSMPGRHETCKGQLSAGTGNYAYAVVAGAMPCAHSLDMDNLSRIREQRGLTQQQLAEIVGANQATISKIEKGVGNPTLAMMVRIARALRVHPSDLFSADDLRDRAQAALRSIESPERLEAAIVVLEAMAGAKASRD